MSQESLQLLRHVLFHSDARVLFITGAGVSVKSGVPLYRSNKSVEDDTAELKSEGEAADDLDAPSAVEAEEDIYVALSDGGTPPGKAAAPRASERAKDEREATRKPRRPVSNNNAIWDHKLEMMARRSSFLVDPRAWYRYFWFDTHHVEAFLRALPNEVHFAIGALCQLEPTRFKCITQNVDALHQRGGCPSRNLIEVHGRIGLYRCTDELCPYGSDRTLTADDLQFMSQEEESRLDPLRPGDYASILDMYAKEAASSKAASDKMAHYPLPCCPRCRSLVMPMTLLFDETYESHKFFQYDNVVRWLKDADVIIFAGTSFAVYFTAHAIVLAMALRKLVFNLNLQTAAEGEFGGYERFHSMNQLTGSTGRSKRDRGREIPGEQLDFPNEGILFNWESGDDTEREVSRVSSSSSTPLTPPSKSQRVNFRNLRRATLAEIIMPADEALMAVLPVSISSVVQKRQAEVELEELRHRWRGRDSLIPEALQCYHEG